MDYYKVICLIQLIVFYQEIDNYIRFGLFPEGIVIGKLKSSEDKNNSLKYVIVNRMLISKYRRCLIVEPRNIK